jgi:hypothetical protein
MYNKLGLWWSVCHSQRLHIDNKLDYYYYYYYYYLATENIKHALGVRHSTLLYWTFAIFVEMND